jgi:hypothetical protein
MKEKGVDGGRFSFIYVLSASRGHVGERARDPLHS